MSHRYRALRDVLGAPPSTGLVAISRLLASPLAELKLFGITFCREPYYPGYLGHGARPENWSGNRPAGPIWRHDMERELQFFNKWMSPDPRLQVDERSANLMK